MSSHREALRKLVERHGDDIPLDRGAALLAADEQPGASVDDILFELDDLATGLRLSAHETLITSVARLNHYLFEELGFRGDANHYDDPRNNYLDYALEWRRGLPIILSIIMIEVARRAGLQLHPIGFPGHFLVGVQDSDATFYVDPFRQGKILTREKIRLMVAPEATHQQLNHYLAPVHGRTVLIQMCNNLRRAWLKRLNVQAAMRSDERLKLLVRPEL